MKYKRGQFVRVNAHSFPESTDADEIAARGQLGRLMPGKRVCGVFGVSGAWAVYVPREELGLLVTVVDETPDLLNEWRSTWMTPVEKEML